MAIYRKDNNFCGGFFIEIINECILLFSKFKINLLRPSYTLYKDILNLYNPTCMYMFNYCGFILAQNFSNIFEYTRVGLMKHTIMWRQDTHILHFDLITLCPRLWSRNFEKITRVSVASGGGGDVCVHGRARIVLCFIWFWLPNQLKSWPFLFYVCAAHKIACCLNAFVCAYTRHSFIYIRFNIAKARHSHWDDEFNDCSWSDFDQRTRNIANELV